MCDILHSCILFNRNHGSVDLFVNLFVTTLSFQRGVVGQVTPDSAKRPRRRWSHRMGSLELIVKSMMDLRQLETFAHKKNPNCPPYDRERQSMSSLQDPMVCMDGYTVKTERNVSVETGLHVFCLSLERSPNSLSLLQQQLEERAKRHRPWPHADWLSSHTSKGIKGTDGVVLYPEENEDDTGLPGR